MAWRRAIGAGICAMQALRACATWQPRGRTRSSPARQRPRARCARGTAPRTLSGACTGRRSVSGAAFLFSRQRGRVRRHRRKAQGQGHPVAEHKHGMVDMQVNTQHGGHIVYWSEPDGHAGARSPWVMRETARVPLQIGTGSTLASREMNHSPSAWPAHSRPSPNRSCRSKSIWSDPRCRRRA